MSRFKTALGAAAVLMAAPAAAFANEADPADRAELAAEAQVALDRCRAVSDVCTMSTDEAAGVLVFPNVVSASILVGGAGARGVLMVGGEIADYYGLGEASVGLQAGVDRSSHVYALNDEALRALEDDGSWKIGADAEITVVEAGAAAQGLAGRGDVEVFVLNQEGLAAGVSVQGLNIFRLDDDRPFEDEQPNTRGDIE